MIYVVIKDNHKHVYSFISAGNTGPHEYCIVIKSTFSVTVYSLIPMASIYQ